MKTCTKEAARTHIEAVIKIENEGVAVDPLIFKDLDYENTYLEQIRARFDWNFKNYVESKIPAAFHFSSSNFYCPLYWNEKSDLNIQKDGEKFFLVKGTGDAVDVIDEITFDKKPKFYNLKTTDGKDMSRIAQAASTRVDITYSNECSLRDKGLDCKFCHGDPARNHNGLSDQMKNPKQIGETYKRAIDLDGAVHFQLTGGFLPERREVEYYLDIADALREATGLENFHANACVGSPLDLSVFDNYKEAGFETIASNLEIWDEGIFKAICPGKFQECGGWKHWVEGLVYAAKVFGHGNVGSNFVAGLEPKSSLLAGVQYLAENGVVPSISLFRPIPGSDLWGHRSPDVEWHLNVGTEIFKILDANKFTWDNLWHVTPSDGMITQDIFRIEKGLI